MAEKMTDGRRLRLARGLRSMIPGGFACKPGCFSCCKTPVQMLKVEWENIMSLPVTPVIAEERQITAIESLAEHEKDLVLIQDEKGWCPFVDHATGACRIYDERPLVCRLYAQSPLVRCVERVSCPPEAEISGDVVAKYGRLTNADYDFAEASPQERDAMLWAMDEWRRRNPDKPVNMTLEDLPKEVHPIFRARLDMLARGAS